MGVLLGTQQQRLEQVSNGMDGTAVGDGKADALENGSVPEDKLAEEAGNYTCTSLASLISPLN